MKKLCILLFLGLFALKGVYATTLYPIEIISKTPKVTISKTKISQDSGKIVLSGVVKRTYYNSSVVPGHIDITIKDNHNRIIEKSTLKYSPSLSLRRWKFGSRFHYVLPVNLPQGSSIQIGWHSNRSNQPLISSNQKSES